MEQKEEPKEGQPDKGKFVSLNLESIHKAGVYCNVLAAISGNHSDFKCYLSGVAARAYGKTSHPEKQKVLKSIKKFIKYDLMPKKDKKKNNNNYIANPYDKNKPFAQIPNNLISLPQDILRFYACLSWAYKTGKKVNEYVLRKTVNLQFTEKTKSLEDLTNEFKAIEGIPNRLELLEVFDPNTPDRFDKEKESKPAKKVSTKKDQKVVVKSEEVYKSTKPITSYTQEELGQYYKPKLQEYTRMFEEQYRGVFPTEEIFRIKVQFKSYARLRDFISEEFLDEEEKVRKNKNIAAYSESIRAQIIPLLGREWVEVGQPPQELAA